MSTTPIQTPRTPKTAPTIIQWPEATPVPRRSNWDKGYRMVSQFGERGAEDCVVMEIYGRDASRVRVAANLATERVNGDEYRRQLNVILTHWQKFAARLAKRLGCLAVDTEIEATLETQLAAAQRTLAEQAGRIGELERVNRRLKALLGRSQGWLQSMRDTLVDLPEVMDTDPDEVKEIEGLMSENRSLLQHPPAKPEAKTLQGEAR